MISSEESASMSVWKMSFLLCSSRETDNGLYHIYSRYILSLYIVCVCCMKILHCDQFHMAPAHVHTQGSRVIHNHYLCNSVTYSLEIWLMHVRVCVCMQQVDSLFCVLQGLYCIVQYCTVLYTVL